MELAAVCSDLDFVRVDLEGDGGSGCDVGGLVVVVVLVQLLVELADVIRHGALGWRLIFT